MLLLVLAKANERGPLGLFWPACFIDKLKKYAILLKGYVSGEIDEKIFNFSVVFLFVFVVFDGFV